MDFGFHMVAHLYMDFRFSTLVSPLQGLPLWIFWAPLVVLLAICIRFRRWVVLRTVCLAISLLIALAAVPVCAAKAYLEAGSRDALKLRFGDLIDVNCVARYLYRFIN